MSNIIEPKKECYIVVRTFGLMEDPPLIWNIPKDKITQPLIARSHKPFVNTLLREAQDKLTRGSRSGVKIEPSVLESLENKILQEVETESMTTLEWLNKVNQVNMIVYSEERGDDNYDWENSFEKLYINYRIKHSNIKILSSLDSMNVLGIFFIHLE